MEASCDASGTKGNRSGDPPDDKSEVELELDESILHIIRGSQRMLLVLLRDIGSLTPFGANEAMVTGKAMSGSYDVAIIY